MTDGARTPTPRRRRGVSAGARLGIVGVVGALVLGAFVVNGLQDNMVYYHTPSEVLDVTEDRVRLGGMVADGSIDRDGGVVTFTITDGVTDVPVTYDGSTTGVFREGQGAIVEGVVSEGTFRADNLLVKHDNEYVSEDGTTYEVDEVSESQ
ncbi:cytochrome c maturation protein CcmE [Janibacter cremeus]|uniref:cytochrome c maturation protein CcmE n=1 Tax=Janibacter cremeus TaxID=1285192 RepID=UPI0023F6436D|nr:cytochrome c maturation protein CcmE [Janibacter cremeus]WEV78802.1 cytochrome c maturation protein CcmE [Janibacter cremeus]